MFDNSRNYLLSKIVIYLLKYIKNDIIIKLMRLYF